MKVELVVFLSLVLDLFAFTIPLPLFPRIIEWYTVRERSDPNGLLSQTLTFVSSVRAYLTNDAHSAKWDIVLLGGIMGSVFSALQWFVSPRIGVLSDKYGRKSVLLVTMIGNVLSALVWVKSTTFALYMLSRIIGGLSEGNVQLAQAILSDVTTPANRSKALAHIGIAFAVCFCIGPPIGAYFASRPLPISQSLLDKFGIGEVNIYATPALITVVLLVLETVFLIAFLPETKGIKKPEDVKQVSEKSTTKEVKTKRSATERLTLLRSLGTTYALFLAIFSGMEYTLTFLTFDLFDWTNVQNGALIGGIGVISTLLQGGYVRRSIAKTGEGAMARRGVSTAMVGLALLAVVPSLGQSASGIWCLRGAAVCLAFTSATVVNALTAFASLQCSEDGEEEHPDLAKGKALGVFRSSGQLGRAIGPLLACAGYWTFGPTATYAVGAASMGLLAGQMSKLAKPASR